jgi:hypothetical protein
VNNAVTRRVITAETRAFPSLLNRLQAHGSAIVFLGGRPFSGDDSECRLFTRDVSSSESAASGFCRVSAFQKFHDVSSRPPDSSRVPRAAKAFAVVHRALSNFRAQHTPCSR